MRRLVRTAVPAAALAVLAAALSLTGCSTGGDDGRRSIVVTTNILGDITRSIAGDAAEVTVLMPANADPHSFGISAPQAAAIERADLIVHNGLGLEENVLRHVDAAAEAGVPVFAAGAAVDPIDYGTDETAGSPDPHFWTDPERVHRAVGLIADQITKHVDGVDAKAVRAGADRYRKEIGELTRWMRKSFGEIPEARRNLVTNHHVFGYLAQRFGFRVIGAVIPSGTTLASPSASDLESLVTAVDRAGVRAVFADSSQPDRLAQVLGRESERDIRVIPLFSESLTEKGGGAGTYLDMMRANTRSIVAGLAP